MSDAEISKDYVVNVEYIPDVEEVEILGLSCHRRAMCHQALQTGFNLLAIIFITVIAASQAASGGVGISVLSGANSEVKAILVGALSFLGTIVTGVQAKVNPAAIAALHQVSLNQYLSLVEDIRYFGHCLKRHQSRSLSFAAGQHEPAGPPAPPASPTVHAGPSAPPASPTVHAGPSAPPAGPPASAGLLAGAAGSHEPADLPAPFAGPPGPAGEPVGLPSPASLSAPAGSPADGSFAPAGLPAPGDPPAPLGGSPTPPVIMPVTGGPAKYASVGGPPGVIAKNEWSEEFNRIRKKLNDVRGNAPPIPDWIILRHGKHRCCPMWFVCCWQCCFYVYPQRNPFPEPEFAINTSLYRNPKENPAAVAKKPYTDGLADKPAANEPAVLNDPASNVRPSIFNRLRRQGKQQ